MQRRGPAPTALLSVMSKELRQTFRDRRMVALLIMAPVMQLIILGYAVNLDVDRVPTVIADADRSPESRRFVDGLVAGDAFSYVGDTKDAAAALAVVSRGEAPIALVVPRGFGRRLARGKTAQVQVLVDGGDSTRATIAQNALHAYVLREAMERTTARLGVLGAARGVALHPPSIASEPRIFYNPTLDSHLYFVPGVAATLLIVVTLIVTAMSLAREKETGTLEQVMVTPLGTTTLVIGKTLPFAGIGLVDLGLVVVAGAWIFDVPIRGSLLLLFLGGLLYLMTTLGTGLLVATIARNQQQALMGAFLIIMPFILLSGFITPVENMPAWLQPVTLLDPLRHFVELIRAVLLKDAGFAEMAPQLLALLALGLGIFTTAVVILRRHLS